MKYKGKDYMMCDAWHLNVDERIHVFNLRLPGTTENMSVAHAYTDDLLHFKTCDDILPPLKDENLPEDYLDKWTGCAVTAPNGDHYIYYTMRNKAQSQKIGLAITKDLQNFELYKDNPVLVPDKNVFAYTGASDIKEDCRDMVIIWDDASKKYYGYFAAMSNDDDRYTGVIGVAESTDLLNWSNQKVVYKPRFDGIMEVPDVFYLDGKWWLTALTHTTFGAKGTFSDQNVLSGTIYASSDSPVGPFIEGEDNIFIGGTHASGYTCRTFMYKGKRYVTYIDKSKDEWAVSLPKEVCVVDGNLRPCYSEILQKLRVKELVKNLTPDMLSKQSSSIAWNVGNSDVCQEANEISITTNPHTYQHYIIRDVEAPAAEIECGLELKCVEGGFYIVSNKNEYYITANTNEKTLTVYEKGRNFIPFSRRNFDFNCGQEYNIRIIALEGQIEVYVDDVLVIQNAFETGDIMKFGLITGCGETKFKNFKLYELENEKNACDSQ